MSIILQKTTNYETITSYEFNPDNINLIFNDISTNEKEYNKFNEDITSLIKYLLQEIIDEEYNNQYTPIFEVIKGMLDDFNDAVYDDAIKKSLTISNDSKNSLTPAVIKILFKSNVTINELKNLLETETDEHNKDEINKKITEINIKQTTIQELDNKLLNSHNITSIYQKSNIYDIHNNTLTFDKILFDTQKFLFDTQKFEEISVLNYGMYPKLISLMLHPKYFCDMWYKHSDIINDQKPYNIINNILNTLFILSYTHMKINKESFTNKNNTIFKRDTLICKSLQIQNLKNFKKNLFDDIYDNNMNMDMDKIIKHNLELKFIDDKINKIKSDKNQYIFNYKLLNELQKYYNDNLKKLEKLKTVKKNDDNYENILELYYYYEQITNSIENIKILESNITCGINKIDDSQSCEYKNYLKIIDDKYIELMSSHAQVLTYVKERNDAHIYNLSGKMNPRYKIELINDIQNDVYQLANSKSLGNDPSIKYYDLNISYFNYPKSIGLLNEHNPYFDSTTWPKNTAGKFEGYPTKLNYQHIKAEKYVNNHSNSQWEKYYLGKINRYYGWKITSEQISEDSECGLILLEKLRRFEDIIIVGNGQSGAGKTAALIGYNLNNEPFPGLLPNLANKLIKPEDSEDSDDSIQYFQDATVELINLYINLDDNLTEINGMEPKHYNPYYIKLFNTKLEEIPDKEYNFVIKDNTWKCTHTQKEDKTLDEIINEAFEIREVEPTKNNPNSSRSHIIVCVTFKGKTIVNGAEDYGYAKIVICDFAGVEDKFTCNLSELILLDRNYNDQSDKYKLYDKNNNKLNDYDIIMEKQIKYDNYFCLDKYTKDINLFPKNEIIKRNNLITKVDNYINEYKELNINNDPIINMIIKHFNDFKKKPFNANANANDYFKTFLNSNKKILNIDDSIIEKIINININKIKLDYNLENDLLLKKYNKYKYESLIFDCNNIDNCCNKNIINAPDKEAGKKEAGKKEADEKEADKKGVEKKEEENTTGNKKDDEEKNTIENKIKNITNFMKDFTKLEDKKFEEKYKGYEINKIKENIINEIKKIKNKVPDNYFLNVQIDNFIFDFKNTQKYIEKQKKILEHNINQANKKYENIITNINQEKSKLENIRNKNILNTTNDIKKIEIEELKKKVALIESNKYELTKKESFLSWLDTIKNINKDIITIKSKENYDNIMRTYEYEYAKFNKVRMKIEGLKIAVDRGTRFDFTNTEQIFKNEIKNLKDTIKSIGDEKQINQILKTKLIEYNTEKENIDKITPYEIKQNLDKNSLLEHTTNIKKITNENNQNIINYINNYTINEYYNKLISYIYDIAKKKYDKDIKNNTRKTDYDNIKLLIQQYIRLSQLEFNCNIRRKEGYMINTSLKEMQKFIGSILFDSAKNRFNKLLIDNNLLVMERKHYRDSDYIEYNERISTNLNLIKSEIAHINNYTMVKLDTSKEKIIKNLKEVKKEVLKYFTYILSTLDNNYTNYTTNINLCRLLIYICFIDAINHIIINDYINFDIIFYLLSTMGDKLYYIKFTEFTDNITNIFFKMDMNNSINQQIEEIFVYNNINILNLVYQYSKIKNKTEKLKYIITIINTLKEMYNVENDITIEDNNIDLNKITKISAVNVKFNTIGPEFEYFNNAYTQICDILYNDTKKQLEKSKEQLEEVLKKSTDSHLTPLLYSSPSTDLCIKNKYKYENEYEKFYNDNNNKTKNNLEMLFNIMKTPKDKQIIGMKGREQHNFKINGFGLNMDKSTLVIFTVINVTPNPTAPTNNPPIPPFININKLKLIYKIVQIPLLSTVSNEKLFILKQNINEICEYYKKKINKYTFYNLYNDLFTEILTADSIFDDYGNKLKEKIIDLIDSNNATTLIGTVDFDKFTKIRDPSEPYFICDDKEESVLKLLDNIDYIIKILKIDENTEIKETEPETTNINYKEKA